MAAKWFNSLDTNSRAKALLLVIPPELEIFYHDLGAKALLLVIPTELQIVFRDLEAKALLLVIPTELDQIL